MNERERLIELLDSFNRNISNYAGNPKLFVVDDNQELADHLLANGVTVQRWIPVTERLPETNGFHVWVIACVDGNKSCVRLFERATVRGKLVERFKYPWENITYENITHWMPLPEPAKEEV